MHGIPSDWFFFDGLSIVMATLVVFMTLNVGLFAAQHMKGDSQYTAFFFRLSGLSLCLITMVSTNHLLLMWGAILCANLILSRLIVHNPQWHAAKMSGRLARKNFLTGALFLMIGFLILMGDVHTPNIQDILAHPLRPRTLFFGGLFITLGAFTQSGVWPFHEWLKSSLNAPTSVSGFMHAGLVNGGGFLLVRFAPLYMHSASILSWLLIIGFVCSILGTLWKLVSPDIKRMLACSTIAQMGFMVVQCGLGLFPAAIAHVCWHGLFKSHLFLSNNTLAQQKKYTLPQASWGGIMLGLPLSCLGACTYGIGLDLSYIPVDSRLFLFVVVWLFSFEVSFAFTTKRTIFSFLKGALLIGAMGYSYGFFVHFIEQYIVYFAPQKLTYLSVSIFGCYVLLWAVMAFQKHLMNVKWLAKKLLPFYVQVLNGAQPSPHTITPHRQNYH